MVVWFTKQQPKSQSYKMGKYKEIKEDIIAATNDVGKVKGKVDKLPKKCRFLVYTTVIICILVVLCVFFSTTGLGKSKLICKTENSWADKEWMEYYSFSIDNEGHGWQTNKTYNFTFVAKAKKEFHGKFIFYLKPIFANGLTSPEVRVTPDNEVFPKDISKDIKGTISTVKASPGRYVMCVTIKNENNKREWEKCDTNQQVEVFESVKIASN